MLKIDKMVNIHILLVDSFLLPSGYFVKVSKIIKEGA